MVMNNKIISEELETLKKLGWDKISHIRKTTQDAENRKNISNALRHAERLELLQKIEESIPLEKAELENKLKSLMEIEQADELQNVII